MLIVLGQKSSIEIKQLLVYITFILIIVNIGFLIWYLFIGYQQWFHADSAMRVLLAREVFLTKSFFPAEWNYVNELAIVNGHLIILPLLFFLPAGYLSYAIFGLVYAAILLYGVWLVTKTVNIETWQRLLVVAIFSAGISGFMIEQLYGQASYGPVLAISCYLIYFASRFLDGNSAKEYYYPLLLFILTFIVFWQTPQRSLVYFGLPLLVALCGYWKVNANLHFNDKGRKSIILIILLVVGIISGSLLNLFFVANANVIEGAGQAKWLSYDLVLRNITLSLKGFMAAFGGLPTEGSLLTSLSSIYEAFRIAAAYLLLGLIIYATTDLLKGRQKELLLLGLYALVLFAGVFFIQSHTTVPDMNDPIPASRYLIPALTLLLLYVLLHPYFSVKKPYLMVMVAVVSFAFASSGYITYVKSTPYSEVNWAQSPGGNNVRMELIDFLEENNLQYGFSTYWHANAITVLSNENVLLRQVEFADNGLPFPMRHLASNRWYRADAWDGKTFLLLTEEEENLVNWNNMAGYQLVPEEVLSYGHYKIYVFTENNFASLPGWVSDYSQPVLFAANDSSYREIGRYIKDHSLYGEGLLAEVNEMGALHYGPYIRVEPGLYEVSFEIFANYDSNGVAMLDVATGSGNILLAEKRLTESDGMQVLEFELHEESVIEFRVFSYGNQDLFLKGITLVKR